VNKKVIRKAEDDVDRDDPRLCIRIIEEGKFQEEGNE
jgi:hypothetical protein